jgi:hypothetical protein
MLYYLIVINEKGDYIPLKIVRIEHYFAVSVLRVVESVCGTTRVVSVLRLVESFVSFAVDPDLVPHADSTIPIPRAIIIMYFFINTKYIENKGKFQIL